MNIRCFCSAFSARLSVSLAVSVEPDLQLAPPPDGVLPLQAAQQPLAVHARRHDLDAHIAPIVPAQWMADLSILLELFQQMPLRRPVKNMHSLSLGSL
jgi:hypothetical protein